MLGFTCSSIYCRTVVSIASKLVRWEGSVFLYRMAAISDTHSCMRCASSGVMAFCCLYILLLAIVTPDWLFAKLRCSHLQSPVPDSVGELKLVYVCGLRTSNEGRRYNTRLSSSTPKPNIAPASRNRSFPRASCGDPFHTSGTYWSVFIDGGNVSRVRANFCNDAFATVRFRYRSKVSLASFLYFL